MGRTIYRVVLEGMTQHLGSTAAPTLGVRYGVEGMSGVSEDDGSSWWAPLSRVIYILALDEDKVKLLQQQMRDAMETDRRRQELIGMKPGGVS